MLEAAATTVRGVVAGAVASVSNPFRGGDEAPDAITLLENDHRRMEDLLARGEDTTERAKGSRTSLLDTLTSLQKRTVRPVRVLSIDDEEVARYLVRQCLPAPAFEILEAEDGRIVERIRLVGVAIGAGALAQIGVDIVEADRGVPDARFARARLAHLDRLVAKHLRPTGLVQPNRHHHNRTPFALERQRGDVSMKQDRRHARGRGWEALTAALTGLRPAAPEPRPP